MTITKKIYLIFIPYLKFGKKKRVYIYNDFIFEVTPRNYDTSLYKLQLKNIRFGQSLHLPIPYQKDEFKL